MPTIIRTAKPIDLEISTKYKTLKFLCIHSKACHILSDIEFNIMEYWIIDIPKYMNSNIHIHLGKYEYTFNYDNIKVDNITLMPYIVY